MYKNSKLMKHLIFGLVMLALFALTGCSKDEATTTIPEVSAEVLETGTDFIKLSIDITKSESGSYFCLPAFEKAPTPGEILTKGKLLKIENKKQEVKIDSLEQETDYIIYIAARNATEVKTINIPVTTLKGYIQDVTMKDGWIQYYGDFYKNKVGYYMVALSDGPISNTGLPTRVGDKALHLFIGDAIPLDGDNASLKTGTYRISDEHEQGTADAYNCKFIISTAVENGVSTAGYTYRFVDGTITIEYTGDNTYSFLVDAKIELESGEQNIRCSFTGKLPFTNQDPARYNPLRENITVVPKGLSGWYTKSSNGEFGTYNFSLYNTPIDASGFVAGAGEVVMFTLLAPYSERMDIEKLVGTYENVVISEPGSTYTPPAIIAGMYSYFYGMYAPQGSFYSRYNDAGQIDLLGLFIKGKVVITKDGDNITLKGDMITIQNKNVKIEYTGSSTSIVDFSQSSSPLMILNHKSGSLSKAIPLRKTFTKPFYL